MESTIHDLLVGYTEEMATKKQIKRQLRLADARLWGIFALYVKYKHSADGVNVDCFTCGKSIVIGTQNCHAGHWQLKKQFPYHKFNEDNVRPQCARCNLRLFGDQSMFERNLIDEIGRATVNKIINTREVEFKPDLEWYEERLEYFGDGIEQIRTARGWE